MEKANIRVKNRIIVILGPTSSGKSGIGIKLAKKFNGEIISADSRQIYRRLNIGTGKIARDPSRAGLKSNSEIYRSEGIAHHLIDAVDPKTEYNVARFKKDAIRVINDTIQRGKLPIICGGTGFWIRTLVDDVDFPEVKPDWKLREKLGRKSADVLFTLLKKFDPERAKKIDAKNKVRLIRALEICLAIGKVPKIKEKEKNKKYAFLQIGIGVSKEKLHKKIKKRLEERWKEGMIDEVRKLKKSGLSWKKIQSFGLGYFWIPLYLKKKISEEELFEKIYSSEKNYAKRQLTWFRKDKRIVWLENYKKIQKTVGEFLDKH